MTENILSSCDALGNSDAPCQVVVDELGSSPLAALIASRIDLEELKFLRGSLGGVGDLGEVVEYRTDVRFRPGVLGMVSFFLCYCNSSFSILTPLDINSSSGCDLGNLCASSGVLVASNLGDVGVHAGIDEAIVLTLWAGPLNDLGRGSLVLERRVVCRVGGAINVDSREMAMSIDGRGESSNESSDLDFGRHCW